MPFRKKYARILFIYFFLCCLVVSFLFVVRAKKASEMVFGVVYVPFSMIKCTSFMCEHTSFVVSGAYLPRADSTRAHSETGKHVKV